MKVTELTELSSVAGGDILYIVDDPGGAPVGKKVTVTNLLAAASPGSHTHPASDIVSGVLAHERGGLEFDASGIAKGGIIVGTASGVMGLLTAGTDGQVATMQADGSIAWEDAIGGAVDALELKSSVKAATTANITLSGEQTIDGVSCVSGDRVLVKDQSTGSENGIYVVGEYGWTRATDYAADDAAAATFGHIQQGTANGDKKWLCTNNTGSDTIDTHALTYSLDSSGAGSESSTLKAPVKVATTEDITLAFEQTVDGVSITTGDRVLVKDQSTGSENGIYVADSSNWTRATDYAVDDEVAGTFGHIEQGTVNADKKWLCTNNSGSDVVDTDSLAFVVSPISGDFDGPGSSTDDAIATWDGTTGDLLQDTKAKVRHDSNYVYIETVGDTNTFALNHHRSSGHMFFGFDGSTSFAIGDQGVRLPSLRVLTLAAERDDGNSSTAKTIDWSEGNVHKLTLTGNCTLTFTDPTYHSGGGTTSTVLTIKLIQDGTGSRTVTWPASVKWPGGTAPTLTTTAGAEDLVNLIFDGTNYYAEALLDMQ